jgi:hypothetical protein
MFFEVEQMPFDEMSQLSKQRGVTLLFGKNLQLIKCHWIKCRIYPNVI